MHRFERLAVHVAICMAAVPVVALVMQLAGCWPT